VSTTTGTGVAERMLELLAAGDFAGIAALHADDAFLDANVPQWRFQVARAQLPFMLAEGYAPGSVIASSRVFGGGEWQGFEVELRWQQAGEDWLNREVHVLRVVDGLVTEHTLYCTGEWDAATIRRQAAEAPMILP
jgi:hypothetical protein